MQVFNNDELRGLFSPLSRSHKGQNGKLLIVGGSHLFHAASIWALTIASRIVDMVFYSSVQVNNEIVALAKREFRNGIVVPRDDLDRYAEEADVIVIGPGMVRGEELRVDGKYKGLKEIGGMRDEGEQSYYLTGYLLEKFSKKKWVIDAGALQMMELEWIKQLEAHVILTPHRGEFERLRLKVKDDGVRAQMEGRTLEDQVALFAKAYNCIVLLKGPEDVVCPSVGEPGSREECVVVRGGNAGMTKGGTGDVLAGLVGALSCNNDLWIAAKLGSYFNKRAGDSLFEKVGYYFNASDLADEIPRVMRLELLAVGRGVSEFGS
jgi:NAD(P)H-hydrate epimerase